MTGADHRTISTSQIRPEALGHRFRPLSILFLYVDRTVRIIKSRVFVEERHANMNDFSRVRRTVFVERLRLWWINSGPEPWSSIDVPMSKKEVKNHPKWQSYKSDSGFLSKQIPKALTFSPNSVEFWANKTALFNYLKVSSDCHIWQWTFSFSQMYSFEIGS